MLLEIQGLSSHYGRIQALDRVDLAVAESETVALIGANGAGKTTLLRVISGVQAASGGSVQFAGRPITDAPPAARVRLGIAQVPEGRQPFGPLSVEDNLLLGGYTRTRAERRAGLEQIFTLFPVLAERRRQAAGTLSGGEQQMLALGRALMARPRLLLLDEPSMGLAPQIVEQLFRTIAAPARHHPPGRAERAGRARGRRPRLRHRIRPHRARRARPRRCATTSR